MVLELKAPHEVSLSSLAHEAPVFISYLFSFIYIGIYWNNHHHLFQVTEKVNGKMLWANLHLLFWLSLIPFTTSWVGENHIEATPIALYGFNLLMSGVAYFVLLRTILEHHPEDFVLRKVIGKDFKGKISVVLYVIGIGLSFVNTWLAIAVYAIVAAIWIIPDRRIEKNID
jgi:uncharacterized membrane protein